MNMHVIRRPMFNTLLKRLKQPRRFMQVLLGPRQIGKTTLVKQVCEVLDKPTHYVTADLATLQDITWLQSQWESARRHSNDPKGAVLIVDEIQKIPHWEIMTKALWDADTWSSTPLDVVILGSSPWLMQKGLTESLAGRFEIIPMTHWSFTEMESAFGWTIDQYIYFGGYPGAAPLADMDDAERWKNYINDALIETTISRDILLMTQIHKPALLRRLFQLACSYSGQILSYNKMLGELQEAGNTTTLAHYLELLSGVGLVGGIQKYAQQKFRQKASSPKFCVYNTALMSAQLAKNYHQAKQDPILWGRLTESTVGAHLLNSLKGSHAELFYWREADKEVDFVLKFDDSVISIEVKSNSESVRKTGMEAFSNAFHPKRILVVGGKSGIPIVDFLKSPISEIL